jgi:hypothetical protein
MPIDLRSRGIGRNKWINNTDDERKSTGDFFEYMKGVPHIIERW